MYYDVFIYLYISIIHIIQYYINIIHIITYYINIIIPVIIYLYNIYIFINIFIYYYIFVYYLYIFIHIYSLNILVINIINVINTFSTHCILYTLYTKIFSFLKDSMWHSRTLLSKFELWSTVWNIKIFSTSCSIPDRTIQVIADRGSSNNENRR